MGNKLKPSSFIFLIVLMSGCYTHPDRQTLIGKYCRNNNVRDSIFVGEDSTYNHRYLSSSGDVLEWSGTWHYDSIHQEVVFKGFKILGEKGTNYQFAGTWAPKIDFVANEEIRLIYSSEDNIYFSKK